MTDRADLPARLRTDRIDLRMWDATRLHTIANDCDEAAARIDDLEAALRELTEAVSNMRVPQNVAEAALQVTITIGPALDAARAALTPESPQ